MRYLAAIIAVLLLFWWQMPRLQRLIDGYKTATVERVHLLEEIER